MLLRRGACAALLAASLGASSAPLLAQGEAPPRAARKPARKDDKAAPSREERIEKARGLFAAAEERFNAGDPTSALALYREANEIIRSPQAYFRIAQCLERVGTRAEMAEAYHRFLGLPPPETMAEERRIAEEKIADGQRGTLRVSSTPAGVAVEIDGREAQPSPISARLDPGKHLVRVSQAGFDPATREIEIRSGETLELAIELKGIAPPPAPSAPAVAPHEHEHVHAAPAPPRPTRPVALGLLGLSAVGLGVGTIFGLRALAAQRDFDRGPTQDLAQKQRDSALASDVAFGTAVVLAVTGVVFWQASSPDTTEHHHHHHEATLQLVPMLTRDTQGAAAFLRF
jgi:hypothetical protein